MPKTLEAQLDDAIGAGDLAKIRTLREKIKAKATAAPKPARPRTRPAPAPAPAVDDVIDLEDLDGDFADPRGGEYRPENASWMAPSRRPQAEPGRVKEFADGRSRTEGRRVSMRGNTFANTFKDSGKGGYEDPRHARLDKAVVEKTPRATARPAAQRIRVRCEGCRKEKVVPLSEVSVRHDEDMRPERFYRCDRCCTKGV